MPNPIHGVVSRDDVAAFEFVAADEPDPAPGEVALETDLFALTSNNVTYAVYGDALSYWSFFPAPAGRGRLPVWGFADVTASRHDGIGEGERIYGFLPISTSFVMTPGRITAGGFVDGAPHRAELPAVYNWYSRVAADPTYRVDHEAHQALFLPLFMTSFILDDYLADQGFFGADTIIVSSASAKTALGLAFMLRTRPGGPRVVGLTSARNAGFVTGVGYYDEVTTYDAPLAAASRAVYVDFAGDLELLARVHTELGDRLAHSCLVGGSHWQSAGPAPDLPGPKPTFFFAPSQIRKRSQEWGPGGLEKRFGSAWTGFVSAADNWLEVVRSSGPEAIKRVYGDLVGGRVRPDQGHVLAMRPDRSSQGG